MLRIDPALPILRIDPTLPILKMLPLLPMLRIEAKLPTLKTDAALATLSTLNALRTDHRLRKLQMLCMGRLYRIGPRDASASRPTPTGSPRTASAATPGLTRISDIEREVG